MMRRYVLVLLMIAGLYCNHEGQLRETMAQRTYEVGFMKGMLYTLSFALNVMKSSSTREEIDLKQEMLDDWQGYGLEWAKGFCDSLGVVFDSSLAHALLSVYTTAFIEGADRGKRYIDEGRDTLDERIDTLVMGWARDAYKAQQDELLLFMQEVEFERKQPVVLEKGQAR